MMADGLIKALPPGKWSGFLAQLGLEDVSGKRGEMVHSQDPAQARLEAVEHVK